MDVQDMQDKIIGEIRNPVCILLILYIHVNCLFLSEYVAVFGNRYTIYRPSSLSADDGPVGDLEGAHVGCLPDVFCAGGR